MNVTPLAERGLLEESRRYSPTRRLLAALPQQDEKDEKRDEESHEDEYRLRPVG